MLVTSFKVRKLFAVITGCLLAALGGVLICLGVIYSSGVLGVMGAGMVICSCIGGIWLLSYLLLATQKREQLLAEARESTQKISGHYVALETQKNLEIDHLKERLNMLDTFYSKFYGCG
ncbi:candidate inclusion membrane protein,IncA protein [Chlamydia suis]|nr:candidate inclusion membrane protein,IncA protein [Chlamydia suis]